MNYTESTYQALGLLFWLVVIAYAGFVFLRQRLSNPKDLVNVQPQVLDFGPQVTPARKAKPKVRGGHRTLTEPPTPVVFDPKNREHLVALAMLMQPTGRLHPKIRFKFDPSRYDNAYSAVLCAFAEHNLGFTVMTEAAAMAAPKKKKRLAKAQVNRKISHFIHKESKDNNSPVKVQAG